MYSVNDFFSGAGGMGLGFHQAGFRLSGAWDFDKFAVQSYQHNLSDKVKEMDITHMTASDVPYADVWTYGFPCQDLSIAGKQKGMIKGKTRSGLFYEIMRLLKEIEEKDKERLPKVILAENVKMVKKYLPDIEEAYNERGYKMKATLYNSKHFDLPQNRERYFIIGIHKSIKNEFFFPSEPNDVIPKLSSILEQDVDEKFYVEKEKALSVMKEALERVELTGVHACLTPDRYPKRQQGRRAKEEEFPMFTLTAQDRHGVIDVIGLLDIKGQENIRRVYNPEGVSPTLTTSEGGNRQPKILECSMVNQLNYETCFTDSSSSKTHCHIVPFQNLSIQTQKQLGRLKLNSIQDGYNKGLFLIFSVRKLTPREYARLQGFPDSYEQIVSNSQFYKQMGNAVSVPVSKFIAEAIQDFLINL